MIAVALRLSSVSVAKQCAAPAPRAAVSDRPICRRIGSDPRRLRQRVFGGVGTVKACNWPKPVGEDLDTIFSQLPLGISDQEFGW